MKLIDQLQTIYQLLGDNRIQDLGLFKIENDTITTPISGDIFSLFSFRSSLPDESRGQSVIEGLINKVKDSKGYGGINHIGFCYKVASKEAEAKRLVELAKNKHCPIYREPSNDDSDWLFAGDISDIKNPTLEFIPHEGQTNDKWVNYWLPHIQFDVDTDLSPEEIKNLVREFISDRFVPYSIQINGVICIQRVWLGCAEGVNIYLDIATNNRDPNYRMGWERLG